MATQLVEEEDLDGPSPPSLLVHELDTEGGVVGAHLLPLHAGRGCSFSLGREARSHVCLDHPSVSRLHATLEVETLSSGQLRVSIVRTAAARNAVKVQGKSIPPGVKYRVMPSMIVHIGSVPIQIILPDAQVATPTSQATQAETGEESETPGACSPAVSDALQAGAAQRMLPNQANLSYGGITAGVSLVSLGEPGAPGSMNMDTQQGSSPVARSGAAAAPSPSAVGAPGSPVSALPAVAGVLSGGVKEEDSETEEGSETVEEPLKQWDGPPSDATGPMPPEVADEAGLGSYGVAGTSHSTGASTALSQVSQLAPETLLEYAGEELAVVDDDDAADDEANMPPAGERDPCMSSDDQHRAARTPVTQPSAASVALDGDDATQVAAGDDSTLIDEVPLVAMHRPVPAPCGAAAAALTRASPECAPTAARGDGPTHARIAEDAVQVAEERAAASPFLAHDAISGTPLVDTTQIDARLDLTQPIGEQSLAQGVETQPVRLEMEAHRDVSQRTREQGTAQVLSTSEAALALEPSRVGAADDETQAYDEIPGVVPEIPPHAATAAATRTVTASAHGSCASLCVAAQTPAGASACDISHGVTGQPARAPLAEMRIGDETQVYGDPDATQLYGEETQALLCGSAERANTGDCLLEASEPVLLPTRGASCSGGSMADGALTEEPKPGGAQQDAVEVIATSSPTGAFPPPDPQPVSQDAAAISPISNASAFPPTQLVGSQGDGVEYVATVATGDGQSCSPGVASSPKAHQVATSNTGIGSTGGASEPEPERTTVDGVGTFRSRRTSGLARVMRRERDAGGEVPAQGAELAALKSPNAAPEAELAADEGEITCTSQVGQGTHVSVVQMPPNPDGGRSVSDVRFGVVAAGVDIAETAADATHSEAAASRPFSPTGSRPLRRSERRSAARADTAPDMGRVAEAEQGEAHHITRSRDSLGVKSVCAKGLEAPDRSIREVEEDPGGMGSGSTGDRREGKTERRASSGRAKMRRKRGRSSGGETETSSDREASNEPAPSLHSDELPSQSAGTRSRGSVAASAEPATTVPSIDVGMAQIGGGKPMRKRGREAESASQGTDSDNTRPGSCEHGQGAKDSARRSSRRHAVGGSQQQALATVPSRVRVGFSGIKEPERLARYRETVSVLGGLVVESVDDLMPGVVLVVEQNPLRTVKLCAGVSVCELVLPSWLEESAAAREFQDVEPHTLRGEQHSKGVHWDASLARTARETGPGCLAGHCFAVTKHTTPQSDQLKAIISKAGGSITERLPSASCADPLVLVWNDADRRTCQHLHGKKNVFAIKDTELLDCVLRHSFQPSF